MNMMTVQADTDASIKRHVLMALGATPDLRDKDPIDMVLDALAALGIKRIVYALDGGGDSGEAVLAEIEYADGRDEQGLPDIPVGFTASGSIVSLEEMLDNDASERPDINWCDNVGGSGEVVYSPMEPEGQRIECDVCEHEDDDDDENFDYIDDEIEEPDDEQSIEKDDIVIPTNKEEEA